MWQEDRLGTGRERVGGGWEGSREPEITREAGWNPLRLSDPSLCSTGHYLKAPCTEPCGHATCLPCPQGTFLARENHHESRCARCQACDEQGEGLLRAGCGQDLSEEWMTRT